MTTGAPGGRTPAELRSPESPNGADAKFEALAVRVAEHLLPRVAVVVERSVAAALELDGPQLVDAASVAAVLGVTRAYVYEHADELGAERLGDGPRPRLRFDLEAALAANARSNGKRSREAEDQAQSGESDGARRSSSPRLPARLPEPGSVLRSRPRGEEEDRAA